MKASHTLKIGIANLTILFIGLLIVELLFGAWWNPERLNRLRLIRDTKIHRDVSDVYPTVKAIIQYSRDEYGLRGTHERPSEIDILTIGGSTTDQRYLDDTDTWQSVLQRELEKMGRSVVVANAGIDGQSTIGNIRNYDWWFPHIPGLAPRYTVIYVGINDFHIDEGRPNDDLRIDTDVEFLRERSALWNLARTVRGIYIARVRRIGHERGVDLGREAWTRVPLQDKYDFMQPRLDAFARRLRVLIERTRETGSEPICVTQPSRFYRIDGDRVEGVAEVRSYDGRDYNGVDYYHMMRRLDAATEATCREAGALFVDLAVHGDWEDADFYDYVHMTPRGARKVGRLLAERLEGLPW